MVLEVAETITSMLSNSSGFETNIGTCAKNNESAENIQDILKLKDVFLGEMQKVREHSHTLNDELAEHKKNSTLLAEKLEAEPGPGPGRPIDQCAQPVRL